MKKVVAVVAWALPLLSSAALGQERSATLRWARCRVRWFLVRSGRSRARWSVIPPGRRSRIRGVCAAHRPGRTGNPPNDRTSG
jgi:hypothetical protein